MGKQKQGKSVRGRISEVHWRIYELVRQIPEGTVATYGQIAEMANVGPRQVGRALKVLPPDMACPWHRVVNARGAVSIRAGASEAHMSQEELLEAEGVVFRNGRLDLEVYRWHLEV